MKSGPSRIALLTPSRGAAAALGALLATSLLAESAGAQARRAVGATRTAVVIDGATVMADAVAGGVAVGQVVTSQAGPDGTTKKHIAGVKYEDLTLEVGLEAKPILDWAAATLEGKAQAKNLSVVTADFNFKTMEERQIANAQIAEVAFPAIDATSRTPGRLTVRIVPGQVATRQGSGETIQGGLAAKQQQWLPSNFRFELDGVDASRVARIEPFAVGRAVVSDQVGEFRQPTSALGPLKVPNLIVTFSDVSAKSWSDWAESFIVKGNNGDGEEKNGAIVFFSPNRQTELGRVTLSHCGIVRLAPAADTAPGAVGRMTAELYCEGMRLQVGK